VGFSTHQLVQELILSPLANDEDRLLPSMTLSMGPTNTILYNAASFIAALFLLESGADRFIDHTAITGRRLGVSETAIALLTAGCEWEEASRSEFPLRSPRHSSFVRT
jgi:hypothetical protein